VPVPLVIPEKKVLAVGGIDLFPVGKGFLHGGYWGVFMKFIGNVQAFQDLKYFFPFHGHGLYRSK
jgi:hypothetical protein